MRLAGGVALLLLGVWGLVDLTEASVPVQLLPFINYYEVYLEPYNDLTHKLRGPNSYTATLAMLGLVAAGTLGYLPVNLKDVASVIDRKLSGRRQRRRHGQQTLSRRRGWHGPAHRRRWRRAITDPDTLRQLLSDLDPDSCLIRLICEAEFSGPQATSSAEEKIIHQLFSGGVPRVAGLAWLERAAQWGRSARRLGSPRSDCGRLSPRCRHSPLDDLRLTEGRRSPVQHDGYSHLAEKAEMLQSPDHSKDGATSSDTTADE